MKIKKDKKFSNFEVVFLVITTCIISLIVGFLLSNKKEDKKLDQELNEFINTYNEITSKYYKEIDKEELLNGAVSGMLSTLDEHSLLVDKEEDENFYLMLDGSYNGIGIEIVTYEDKNIIVGVINPSPASEAGLMEGDIIKQIDDYTLEGKSSKDVASYIRKDAAKQEFNIIIERNGEELSFNIKRGNVVIKSVASKIIERDEKRIGYIYISIFSNTTTAQFKQELENLKKESIDALIIDVRSNTGGHLTTATSILSMMLDQSNVSYQMYKNNKKTKHYSTGKENFSLPLVIIENNMTASAAEMLTVSLRENLNALVIGETSYGKGTVQEYNYLSNGNMYKYTTKEWLSPKGNSIDGKGIKPDIEVSLDNTYIENPSDENDNQLQTAIQQILNKLYE